MTIEFENFQEFEEYCNKYADYIYVRERIDGKMKSVALSKIHPDLQKMRITEWWMDGRMPLRLKTEDELINEGIDPFDD